MLKQKGNIFVNTEKLFTKYPKSSKKKTHISSDRGKSRNHRNVNINRHHICTQVRVSIRSEKLKNHSEK